MKLVEEIATAVDRKEYYVGIFIDLKKAFDTINQFINSTIHKFKILYKSRFIDKYQMCVCFRAV